MSMNYKNAFANISVLTEIRNGKPYWKKKKTTNQLYSIFPCWLHTYKHFNIFSPKYICFDDGPYFRECRLIIFILQFLFYLSQYAFIQLSFSFYFHSICRFYFSFSIDSAHAYIAHKSIAYACDKLLFTAWYMDRQRNENDWLKILNKHRKKIHIFSRSVSFLIAV